MSEKDKREAAGEMGVCIVLCAGLLLRHGISVDSLCCCAAVMPLVHLSIVDGKTFEIPDSCSGAIAVIGVVRLLFRAGEWSAHLAGALCVSTALLLAAGLSRGRAVGGGDIKLMAAAGLLLGWKACILAFVSACMIGSVIHPLRMKLCGAGRVLAFGPYLTAGIWLTMMWGEPVIAWYRGLWAGVWG